MPQTPAEVLEKIKDVIVEIVEEIPSDFGAPGGHIYAAMMQIGLSLEQYQYIMQSLVDEGRVVRRGQCYFPREKTDAV